MCRGGARDGEKEHEHSDTDEDHPPGDVRFRRGEPVIGGD
jgi:hypothetical protein